MCFELEAGLGLVAIAAMRRAKLEMVFKSRTAARESAPKPFDESQMRVQKADFEENTSGKVKTRGLCFIPQERARAPDLWLGATLSAACQTPWNTAQYLWIDVVSH